MDAMNAININAYTWKKGALTLRSESRSVRFDLTCDSICFYFHVLQKENSHSAFS